MSAVDGRRRGQRQTYHWKGAERTLAEIGRLTGINDQTLADRLRRQGMSLSEAVAKGPGGGTKGPRQKLVSYQGRSLTCKGWDELRGFAAGTLQQRLYLGWSVEDAVRTPQGWKRGTWRFDRG
jgi:hypothetical protein